MTKLTLPGKSQLIRFSMLLATIVVIDAIWFLPFYETTSTNPRLIFGFLFFYIFSIIVLLSFSVGCLSYSLLTLLKNKFHLLQSSKQLLGVTVFWWILVLLVYLTPAGILQPLASKSLSIALFVTGAMALFYVYNRQQSNNNYFRMGSFIYFVLAVSYCGLEIVAAFFIAQHPVINRHFEWRYPVQPETVSTSECLSGCMEHPPWVISGAGANVYINSTVRWYRPDRYDVIHTYNNMGLRGPDTTYDSDKYRILILGDSYVNGLILNNEDTIGLQLQTLLDDYGSADGTLAYEVLQLGVYGWSEVSAYTYYTAEGYKFAPDVVLYIHTASDLGDVNRAYFLGDTLSYEVKDGNLYTHTATATHPNFIDAIESRSLDFYRRSHFRTPLMTLLITAPLVDRILAGEIFSEQQFEHMAYDDLIADAGISHAQKLTHDLFALWQQQVQESGGTLALIHMGTPDSYREGNPVTRDRLFFNTLQAQPAPVIDTVAPLHHALQNGVDIDYFDEFENPHLTPEGNRELVIVIFDWLVEQGFVEAG